MLILAVKDVDCQYCKKVYNGFVATKQSTVDFLEEQLADAGNIRSRKMFGEYALYCDEKVVAFVCDDRLFVKPTAAGKEFLGQKLEEAPPYPGAKNYFLISEDYWEDRDWLAQLVTATANALPLPKPKKVKRS